jgi:cytidylate kinase
MTYATQGVVPESVLPRIISIDGLPGAGKTTQAELIAERLNYTNLTPGMLFCAGGLALAEAHVGSASRDEQLAVIRATDIAFELQHGDKPLVSIDGRDVSELVFQHKDLATAMNAFPDVAELWEGKLRQLIGTGRWVIDRGNRLCPDADLKFWLTATAEARAARRCGQLALQGKYVSFGQVLTEQQMRATHDRTVFHTQPDVRRIDTTHLDAEQVYAQLARIILA